jgi:hypothetical protein
MQKEAVRHPRSGLDNGIRGPSGRPFLAVPAATLAAAFRSLAAAPRPPSDMPGMLLADAWKLTDKKVQNCVDLLRANLLKRAPDG